MARDDPMIEKLGAKVKPAGEQLPSGRRIFAASPFNRAPPLLSAGHERA
jgi:hypothetical protein